ncbi:MAG TPA: GNAT family protein [Kofleriaceae bacterium]
MKAPPRELATERLVLRALESHDAPVLAQLVARNHDRLAESFPSTVHHLQPSGAASYVTAREADWQAARSFWFGLHLDHQLIGQAQIKDIDWDLGRAELAYHIDREHEGRGLATEALACLIDTAFADLRLHKLFLRIIAGNARSIALAERVGFQREGVLRREWIAIDGTRVDIEYFGLLKTDPR